MELWDNYRSEVYATCETIENAKLDYNLKSFNKRLKNGAKPIFRYYKIPSDN